MKDTSNNKSVSKVGYTLEQLRENRQPKMIGMFQSISSLFDFIDTVGAHADFVYTKFNTKTGYDFGQKRMLLSDLLKYRR